MSRSLVTSTPLNKHEDESINEINKKKKIKKSYMENTAFNVGEINEDIHTNKIDYDYDNSNDDICTNEVNEHDDVDTNEVNGHDVIDENLSEEVKTRLIERIQNNIPSNDTLHYKSRLNRLDWNAIKFDNYTSEECRNMWQKIFTKIRKFRTLNEIVEDAKVLPIFHLTNNKPSKPLTSYMLYYLDTKDKVMKKYPGLGVVDVAKHVGKRYKKLSATKLERYKEKAKMLRAEYDAQMKLFSNNSSRVPKKKLGKLKSAFQLFRDAYLESHKNNPDYDKTKRRLKCKKRWDKMSESKKLTWIQLAQSNEDEYKERIKKYGQDHPSFVVPSVRTVLTKNEQHVLDKCSGKPEKPPNSVYSLFSRYMLRSESLKQIPSNGRMAEISRQWKLLSSLDKQAYAVELKQWQNEYQIEYDRYIESLPNSKRAEELAKMKRKNKKNDVQDENAKTIAKNKKKRENIIVPDNNTLKDSNSPLWSEEAKINEVVDDGQCEEDNFNHHSMKQRENDRVGLFEEKVKVSPNKLTPNTEEKSFQEHLDLPSSKHQQQQSNFCSTSRGEKIKEHTENTEIKKRNSSKQLNNVKYVENETPDFIDDVEHKIKKRKSPLVNMSESIHEELLDNEHSEFNRAIKQKKRKKKINK